MIYCPRLVGSFLAYLSITYKVDCGIAQDILLLVRIPSIPNESSTKSIYMEQSFSPYSVFEHALCKLEHA